MGQSDSKLATFLTICIVAFFVGCVMILFAWFPLFWAVADPFAVTVIGVALMLISFVGGIFGFLTYTAARSAARSKSRSGPRRRVAVRIHSVWRTDKGKIVDPYETDLTKPAYHAVLVSEDGKRTEVDAPPEVWQECIEGSWGWAEVQGDWLGAYQRDAELYRKYTGR